MRGGQKQCNKSTLNPRFSMWKNSDLTFLNQKLNDKKVDLKNFKVFLRTS